MSDPLPVRALSNLCALNLLRHRELELRVKLAAEQCLMNEVRRIVQATTTEASSARELDVPFDFAVSL